MSKKSQVPLGIAKVREIGTPTSTNRSQWRDWKLILQNAGCIGFPPDFLFNCRCSQCHSQRTNAVAAHTSARTCRVGQHCSINDIRQEQSCAIQFACSRSSAQPCPRGQRYKLFLSRWMLKECCHLWTSMSWNVTLAEARYKQ